LEISKLEKSSDKSIDDSAFGRHHVAAEFDWHDEKHASNVAKHGIDFFDVLVAFSDPGRMVAEDARRDYGETRYNMLAKAYGRVFHITYTPRGAVTWLISARKANDREQKRYENV
jgi:uncharacterized protein